FCALALDSTASAPSRNPYHMPTAWIFPSGFIVHIVIEWRPRKNASISCCDISICARCLTPWPMYSVTTGPLPSIAHCSRARDDWPSGGLARNVEVSLSAHDAGTNKDPRRGQERRQDAVPTQRVRPPARCRTP